MAENYQGGNETVLTGFYNGLRQDLYRYGDKLAKQQQAQAKQQEELNKQADELLGKINPNGLKNIDIPEFTEKYDKLKELNAQYKSATSQADKIRLMSDFRNEANNIMLFVNASKNAAKEDQNILTNIRNKAGDYEDYSVSYADSYINTPTSKRGQFDSSKIEKRVDYKSAQTLEDNIFKQSLSVGKRAYDKASARWGSLGGNAGQFVDEVVTADAVAIGSKIEGLYETDRNYKKYLDAKYPEAVGNPQAMSQIVLTERQSDLTKRQESFIKKDREPQGGQGTDYSSNIIPSKLINYSQGEGKPVGNFEMRNAIDLREAKALNTGTFNVIDLGTGEQVKFDDSVKEFRVVSIGDVPLAIRDIKNSKGKVVVKKGSLLTKRYADANPDLVDWQEKAIVRVTNSVNNMLVNKDYLANPNESIIENSLAKSEKGSLDQKRRMSNTSTNNQINTVSSQSNKNTPPKPKEIGGVNLNNIGSKKD